MAEDHEAPEAGNSSELGPEVVERQKIAKEWATQRVRSWTVQNEMRSVLARVSASAARGIFDSVNSREIRALQKTVSVAAKARENTASMT